jgi:hypothetical protein
MPKPIKATISGSGAATVLGFNPYQTPLEFWQNIMEQLHPGFNEEHNYTLPIFEGNASTRWGHAFEDACTELTAQKIESKITDQEKTFTKTVNGVSLSCHVDGLIDVFWPPKTPVLEKLKIADTLELTKHRKTLYEGKTTTPYAFKMWGEPGTDKIPRHVMCQVQHNMYLTGAKKAVVSVLVFPEHPEKWEDMGWQVCEPDSIRKSYDIYTYGNTNGTEYGSGEYINPINWATTLSQMGYHHLYYIDRNDELINEMLKKYKEFWDKYVLTKTPPKPMNLDDLKRLYPEPVGTYVIVDEAIVDIIQEYKSIGKEIGKGGNLSKRRDQLKLKFLEDCISKFQAVEDEESADKWIFRDGQGKKLGSWYKDKNGSFRFR